MSTVLRETQEPTDGTRLRVNGVCGPLFSNEPIDLHDQEDELDKVIAIEFSFSSPSPDKKGIFYVNVEGKDGTSFIQGPYKTPRSNEGYMRIPLNIQIIPTSINFIPGENNGPNSSKIKMNKLSLIIKANEKKNPKYLRISLYQKILIYIANTLFISKDFYGKYNGLEGQDNNNSNNNNNEDNKMIIEYVKSFLDSFQPDVTFHSDGKVIEAHSFILWPNGIDPMEGLMADVKYDSSAGRYDVYVKDLSSDILKWLLWFCYTRDTSVISQALFGFDLEKLMDISTSKGEFIKSLNFKDALLNPLGPVVEVFGGMLDVYILSQELKFQALSNLFEDVFISKIIRNGNVYDEEVSLLCSLMTWASFFSPSLSSKLVILCGFLIDRMKRKDIEQTRKKDYWRNKDSNNIDRNRGNVLLIASKEKDISIGDLDVLFGSQRKDQEGYLFLNIEEDKNKDNKGSNANNKEGNDDDQFSIRNEMMEYEKKLRDNMNTKQELLFDQTKRFFEYNCVIMYCPKTQEYIHLLPFDKIDPLKKIIDILERCDPEEFIKGEIRNINDAINSKGNDSPSSTFVNNNDEDNKIESSNNSRTKIYGGNGGNDRGHIMVGSIVRIRDEVVSPNIVGSHANELVFPCKVLALKVMINELGFPQMYAEVTSRVFEVGGVKKYDISYMNNTPPPEMPFGVTCSIPVADLIDI